jgi:hypothetical protein
LRRGLLKTALRWLAVGVLLGSAAAPATATRSADSSARRAYAVRIADASGRFARARGNARITVRNNGGGEPSPAVNLEITPADCPRARPGRDAPCIRLSGTLDGTATAQPRIPDTGSKYQITATGFVHALGPSSATGIARGPGFIARGFCLLRLTVTTPQGTVTLAGKSHRVPGFTSPL